MEFINYLSKGKNLLAYSGGTDSNFLFYKLIEHNIDFDIIHINYNSRDNSIKEEELAKELAKKYNKKLYIKNVNSSDATGSFEKWARDIRHSFFKEIAITFKYNNLILGHNLNDRVEWSLMQFTKGAGFIEFYGMYPLVERDNFTIVRPIINYSKNEILEYLDNNNIKYYYDESNDDQSYRRNYFRHNFVNQLVSEFKKGIVRSYEIMEKEVDKVDLTYKTVYNKDKLYILKYNDNVIKIIDIFLKHNFKYILSYEQKKILEQYKEIVIIVDDIYYSIGYNDNYIFIGKIVEETMSKKFKEKCRVIKVPKKVRPYIFKLNKDIITNLLY